MEKQELFDFIEQCHSKWETFDDVDINIAECYELDVMYEILRYMCDHNIEIPGIDIKNIMATYDRYETDKMLDEDEEINITEIYCDIYYEIERGNIQPPLEFIELSDFFHKRFWHEMYED
ncbi:MAG: hypothetical protein RO257_00760 [Candidatus Kapabacteria bacterium]|jgi:hypothetical protein|nr:hypothetical protein [Candidatus Kapabacteria bacterium]